jgi:NTP pyrophosphatase (non-canonical NTP hydrolase)
MKQLQKKIHQTAKAKGWWDRPRDMPELLVLIHSEISESLEAFRSGMLPHQVYFHDDGKPEGVFVELADAVIRILDAAEYHGVNLEEIIHLKVSYNDTRPYRHGDKKV